MTRDKPHVNPNGFPWYVDGPGDRPDEEVVDDLWPALHAKYPGKFYAHHRLLAEIIDNSIAAVDVGRLLPLLDEAATFVYVSKGGTLEFSRPRPQDRTSMVREPRCLPLRGVVHVPYLTPSGRIVTAPGYDHETQLWLAWDGPAPDPSAVTPDELAAVMEGLLDFAFADPYDRAHALGLLLLPLVRPAIAGATPLHAVWSEMEAAGKTYLGRITGIIAEGKEPQIRGLDGWTSEASRQLVTYLSSNPAYVLLDNLPTGGLIGGSDLHRFVSSTGPIVLRQIGKGSETIVDARPVWVCTVNLPDVDPEQARRTVPIHVLKDERRVRLNADLAGLVKSNRGQVIACLLVLVQRWLAMGRPKPTRSLDGFGEWSDVVGGIIASIGWDEYWLSPAHRPKPKVLGEWDALYAEWPKEMDGSYAWQSPGWVADTIHLLHLVELGTAIAAVSERGEVTKAGRMLMQMAESGRNVGGLLLRDRRTRQGKAYRPEAAPVRASATVKPAEVLQIEAAAGAPGKPRDEQDSGDWYESDR